MADTRVTLRPNGVLDEGAETWLDAGGAAIAASDVNDDSDATYVYADKKDDDALFSLDDLTLPSGAKIRQLRVRCRSSFHSSDSDVSDGFLVGVDTISDIDNFGGQTANFNVPQDGSVYDRVGPWWTNFSAGSPWSNADVDALGLRIWIDSPNSPEVGAPPDEFRHYELYVDVEYNERPAVTIVAPTTVIDDPTPLIEWNYSDPESDPQTKYVVIIEQGDHSGDAEPNLTTNFFNSGEVVSSSTSHQVNAIHDPGIYTVWVTVSDDVAGYGSWDSQLYEYSSTPPGKSVGSLGQIAPNAGIGQNIYVCPAGKSANVSTITVCNRGPDRASFSILSIPNGVAEQAAHAIYSNANLGSHCTVTVTIGMTLDANDVLRGEADSGNLSFSAFGVEQ